MNNDRQSKRDSAKKKDSVYSSKHVRIWSALSASRTAAAPSSSAGTTCAGGASKTGASKAATTDAPCAGSRCTSEGAGR